MTTKEEIRSGHAEVQWESTDEESNRFANGTDQIEPIVLDEPFPPVAGSAPNLSCRLAAIDDILDVDRIPDPVFVIGSDVHIIDLNAHAEQLVGFHRSELIGRSIDDVVAGLEPASAALRAGQHVRFLPAGAGTHARHSDGREIIVEALICPHDHGSVLVIVRPAPEPERRLREDDIVQIVHDLKAPLATISLETELLDAHVDRVDPHAMCKAVHRILLNVSFLDRMIQDLLDLCAIDAGTLVLHRTRTELCELVESVVDRVVATRDRSRVVFISADRMVADVDDLRIERVVANLIDNALKYTPHGSGIVIRLSRSDESACISVQDAGPGVPESECSTIFDKYQRARNARPHDGHGLGLYVSKRIVEAHGGRIGIESVRGVGARFFFEVPLP